MALKVSGTDCSKDKYVKNGASCSFKVDDAKLQNQGVRCEHALCKDGVWSTVQPYCCCVSTAEELGEGVQGGMVDVCPVTGRCLKCPSGDKV